MITIPFATSPLVPPPLWESALGIMYSPVYPGWVHYSLAALQTPDRLWLGEIRWPTAARVPHPVDRTVTLEGEQALVFYASYWNYVSCRDFVGGGGYLYTDVTLYGRVITEPRQRSRGERR